MIGKTVTDLTNVHRGAKALGFSDANGLKVIIDRFDVQPDLELDGDAYQVRKFYSLERLQRLVAHNAAEMVRRGRSHGGFHPAGFSYRPFQG
jgi:hypothetical protein